MIALDDKNPNNNFFIDKNGNIDNDANGNNDDPLPLILL